MTNLLNRLVYGDCFFLHKTGGILFQHMAIGVDLVVAAMLIAVCLYNGRVHKRGKGTLKVQEARHQYRQM